MNSIADLLLKPRVSEKAYQLSQLGRVYVFEVPVTASKQKIAAGIAARFKVTVTDVNVMNSKGKQKRTVRRGGRATFGRRAEVKKAYVTLKPGDSISVFPEDQKAEKAPSKKEKK